MIPGMLRFFTDLFFPPRCLGCRQQGGLVCHSCLEAIPIFPRNRCFFSLPSGTLDGLFVAAPFQADDLLQTLIHQLKYRYATELVSPLSSLFPPLPSLPLVPVPLHLNRLRERGFNQSELLAQELGEVFPCLLRVRDTPPQAKLSRLERLHNVRNAFSVTTDNLPHAVLLIDDVASTLATLSACATALKRHGVRRVYGAVLARGGLV